MLASSERVREELMAAIGRLDTYIDMLRTDIGSGREDGATYGDGERESAAP
jgi:hypothetical protein